MAKSDNPRILKPMLFSIAAILGVFALTIGGYMLYGKLKPKPTPPVVELWINSEGQIALSNSGNILDKMALSDKLENELATWKQENPGIESNLEVSIHYNPDARLRHFLYGFYWPEDVCLNRKKAFIYSSDVSDGSFKFWGQFLQEPLNKVARGDFLIWPYMENTDESAEQEVKVDPNNPCRIFIFISLCKKGSYIEYEIPNPEHQSRDSYYANAEGDMLIETHEGDNLVKTMSAPGVIDYRKLSEIIRKEIAERLASNGPKKIIPILVLVDERVYLKDFFRFVVFTRTFGSNFVLLVMPRGLDRE